MKPIPTRAHGSRRNSGGPGRAVRPARGGRRSQVCPGQAAISCQPGTNQVFTIHNINSGNGSLRGRLVRTRKRSYVPASGVWERPRGPSPYVRVSGLRGFGSGAVLFWGWRALRGGALYIYMLLYAFKSLLNIVAYKGIFIQ